LPIEIPDLKSIELLGKGGDTLVFVYILVPGK